MAEVWIVVAESARAKIYSAANHSADLQEVAALSHAEGRLHEGDLVSDHAGYDSDRTGNGRRVLDEQTQVHTQVVRDFAREIVAQIEAGYYRHAFNELILVAPPRFLAFLRGQLPKNIANCVIEQVDKNLVQHSASQVREHLDTMLVRGKPVLGPKAKRPPARL